MNAAYAIAATLHHDSAIAPLRAENVRLRQELSRRGIAPDSILLHPAPANIVQLMHLEPKEAPIAGVSRFQNNARRAVLNGGYSR